MCSVVRAEPRVGEGAGHVDAQTVLHRHCALHPELIPRIPLHGSCRDTKAQQPCQDQHRPLLLGTPGPQPTHRPTAGAAATASPWSQGLSSVRLNVPVCPRRKLQQEGSWGKKRVVPVNRRGTSGREL